MRRMNNDIRRAAHAGDDQIMATARDLNAPVELLREVAELGRLPVVNFAAGGIATPADAAMMMQLGCDGVFVGSGIFKSGDPAVRGRAIVEATTFYNDAQILAKVSRNLGEAMVGIEIDTIPASQRMQDRGW
jgi:pyridoxal 5'-phosphate synthase pdxS subunit